MSPVQGQQYLFPAINIGFFYYVFGLDGTLDRDEGITEMNSN